jgi:hypothetical protein
MQQTLELLKALERAKLIDKTETGYAPHNWGGRQKCRHGPNDGDTE